MASTAAPTTDEHLDLVDALVGVATSARRGDALVGATDALVERASGRRTALERARHELQWRLMRNSGDLEATHALRVVEAALRRTSRPPAPWSP